ncbi:MAG TPA: TIM-barrel domain-containing protein [Acidimicrobiales bacterium]|nr:TIM-barrel domain-containing protein [Acidimicrobiales bacterium]
MATFVGGKSRLSVHEGHEILQVDAWGDHSARVRSTLGPSITETPGSALGEAGVANVSVEIFEDRARMRNGDLVVEVLDRSAGEFPFPPLVRFFGSGGQRELLSERPSHFSSPPHRHYAHSGGDLRRCEVTFSAFPGERIYGLGQHQHGLLDQKGAVIELIQRNTEVCVPFALSNRGYGFLWNMPGIGRVELATNRTRWVADGARQVDYWVTTGATPAEIVSRYAVSTGLPPMMPSWATGFWQSKLRYRTQGELLDVAREHKRRGLPLSVIVIDYFHWTRQGEWKFDSSEWPDPQAMVDELREMGTEVMVSIWPTVNPSSENYLEMDQRGLLVDNIRSLPLHLPFWDKGHDGPTFVRYYDSTNPEARRYLWQKVTQGYGRYGIRAFWLDACEPEMRPEDPESALYYLGSGTEVQNVYPREHARGLAEGLRASGEKDVLLLCRSAWAGSQRYGAAVWSGDVDSTFEALAAQVPAGLNMSISGIPWWTTDIGGFKGGDPSSGYFRELVARWFQFGVFCPLFRLHGVRESGPLVGPGQTGGPNEVWSFGDETYAIIREQLVLRERLRPYVIDQMATASTTGLPPMRALFLEFPDEVPAWEVADEYMFGPDVLVAPVTSQGASKREVYLPEGVSWLDAWTGEPVNERGWITAEAPPGRIPVYLRQGGALGILSAPTLDS